MRPFPGAFSTLLLAGCSITLNQPVNRFESPETQGSQHIALDLGIQGGNKTVIVPSTTDSPPDVTSPFIDQGYAPTIGAGFGLLRRVDLGLRLQSNAPALLRLKVQLLGPSRADSRPHSGSLALSGGVGYSSRTQRDAATFSSLEAVSESDYFTYDAALIGGYRFSEAMLLYGSVFYTHTGVDGKITQTSPSATASFRGDAIQRGGNLGVEVKSDHVGVMLEVGYGDSEYRSARGNGAFLGGVLKVYGP